MNAIDPNGEALIRNTNVMMTDSGSKIPKTSASISKIEKNKVKNNDNITKKSFLESIGSFLESAWSGVKSIFGFFEKAEKYETVINSVDQVFTLNDYAKYVNNFFKYYDNMEKANFISTFNIWAYAKYGDNFEIMYVETGNEMSFDDYKHNIIAAASNLRAISTTIDKNIAIIINKDFLSEEDYYYLRENASALIGLAQTIYVTNWAVELAIPSIEDLVELYSSCF